MPHPADRGRLRVYLGAAPGVGKTYAMLAEGRRRSQRGTDVVVGFVETHGRVRTEAAIGDLEVVPRRTVRHIWCRCPSTGTPMRCWWPRRGTARADARRPLVGLTASAGTPRGRALHGPE